jgi:hypothetical protein
MKKRIITVACVSMALGLTGHAQQVSAGAETTIEKKTTTTNPSGTVVIENETSRTFKLEGQTHTYTAPADIDLPTYKGKEVTVHTDERGNVTKIERKTVTAP